jgi:predicted transcriptional regulator
MTKIELKHLRNHLAVIKVTLEELRSGACNFSCLEKRVLAQIGTFTTVSTILYFLRDEGYVYKEGSESRASYRMTARGEKLLEALSSNQVNFGGDGGGM